MTPKRILFAAMCALLVIVIIMTGIVINRASKLLAGSDRLSGSTQSSAGESTESAGESTGESATVESTDGSSQSTTESEHIHDYVLTQTIDATCENYGWNIYTCSLCEHMDMPLDERTDPLGHEYDHGVVVSATCTQGGCTRYTCTRCGSVDEQNVTAALDHSWDAGTLIEATCTEGAAMEYHCTRDGCTETKREAVEGSTPTGSHSYGAWTQTDSGTYERTCSACGAVESSDDLGIRKELSTTVQDGETSYVLYEIYVGTEAEPMLLRYEILDYLQSETQYIYDTVRGLVVSYDRGGEIIETVLPLCQDGNMTISAEQKQPEA